MVKEGRLRRNYELPEEANFLCSMAEVIVRGNIIVGKNNHRKLKRQLHECIDLLLEHRGGQYTGVCRATGIEFVLDFPAMTDWITKVDCFLKSD